MNCTWSPLDKSNSNLRMPESFMCALYSTHPLYSIVLLFLGIYDNVCL